MNPRKLAIFLLMVVVVVSGCAIYDRHGLPPAQAAKVEQALPGRVLHLSPETEQAILALDPGHVTGKQIREVLAGAPAPHILNIHGGIYPVHRKMISFAEFLIGMGYPAASLTNPADGTYTFSCYEDSEMMAGIVAWYYERDGLRPMVIGHSQGGMQTVKVLDHLAGEYEKQVPVWDPITWQAEKRCEIIDPLTGKKRPVVGLHVSYASAVGAGGLTRVLPNQWDMMLKLRDIPDSVEEFTGFCKEWDLLGGDYLGYGPANYFKATGKAVVRNVWLPTAYKHGEIPDTEHLLKSQQIIDWINAYHPSAKPLDTLQLNVSFNEDSNHILWAADVWFSIKKHWVLELQRLIRAQNSQAHVT
jgi:hypothetical protein